MKRRTVIVEGPLAYRMRRFDAARAHETGLEIITLTQVAGRLAGGFSRIAEGPLLYTAIDLALKQGGYTDLEKVRSLPGMVRAVARTLKAAWNADVDLRTLEPRSSRLSDLALIERRVREVLPRGVMIPTDLRVAAIARISLAKSLFGSITLDGVIDPEPIWRPLISALVGQLDVEWNAPGAIDRAWFTGRLIEHPLGRPLSMIGDVCADPRSEVVEALRWLRDLLSRGQAKASDIAIVAANPSTWDDHFLVLSKEAGLPVHFSHGVPALSSVEGQACAALADVVTAGLNQDRVRRLLRRLPKSEALARVPQNWWAGIPRRAGLFDLDQWRRTFAVARKTDSTTAEAELAILPILEIIVGGVTSAAAAGKLLLTGESLALWDEALRTAPPAAIALTLQTLRVPDSLDPANNTVWCPAAHLISRPRRFVRLLGLSGRSWPRSDSEDPLLPDHILPRRVTMPISTTDRDRRAFELVCGLATEQVVLSRSLRSPEGSLLSKSPLWPSSVNPALRARTRIPEHAFSESDRLLARPEEAGQSERIKVARRCWTNRRKKERTFHDGIVRPAHPAITRALTRVHSTTSLKRLLRDPLGFVWRYALGWRSIEYLQQPLTLSPLDFGELIHELLRRTVSALEPDPGFAHATSNQVEEALAAAVKIVSVTWPLERPVPPKLLWLHTLDEAARRSRRGLTIDEPLQAGTRSWTELVFGQKGAHSEDAPWDIGTKVGIGDTGLFFGGRIDRVELVADRKAIRISDYKSGISPKNAERLVIGQGSELQRVLYAMAAQTLLPDLKVFVSRLLYLDDESYPISLKGGELQAAISDVSAFLTIARKLVEVGSAIPGPESKDKYNDLRLAHPADLDAYLQLKHAAFMNVSSDLSPLWSRP